ncbi:hypothetical protein N3K63_14465 [Microbacterium sp. W1N]|uniref:hypothetical protein n=1 Tax=Microbacterium festucae TaxID=2977531 RepID=UPI0021BF41E6|nr:hypothetical protein [Microbacterium festucae]MCT9821486.1 hypothetical protein [Microbacterium festucae]
MTTSDVADLHARLDRLERENAALRDPGTARPGSGRWRAVLSAIVIVVAAILVPVSIVAAWARVQLVDEDAFVQTLAPLVDDPSVQQLVIDETMDAVSAQVDFDQLTADVFAGVKDLGLGPRASAALDLLQRPAADGLTNLVDRTVTTVVQSDAFSDIWATTVRGVHRALTVASTSDGGGVVVMTADGVGIQLGPIVEQVKQRLIDQGVGVAAMIPAVDRTVIVGTGETLTLVRTGYAVAATMGWWLPVITLALFALGIALARRRSVAVVGTGVALAIGGGSLGAALGIGATAMTMVGGQLDLSPAALEVVYGRLVDDMRQTAWVLALLGVVVAVIGWLVGRGTAARRVRAALDAGGAAGRRALARRGIDTGGFGRWLGRNRVLVRVLLAVLAVLWLFALRPLGLGDILLVLVVTLAVMAILELLQQRPDETVAIVAADADTAVIVETDADTEVVVEADADTAVVVETDADTAELDPTTDDAPAAPTEGSTGAPTPRTPRR